MIDPYETLAQEIDREIITDLIRLTNELVVATYTNWKGEVSERKFQPIELFFGQNEWHPTPQWLLRAWDIEKKAERTFAMKDLVGWTPKGFNKESPGPVLSNEENP